MTCGHTTVYVDIFNGVIKGKRRHIINLYVTYGYLLCLITALCNKTNSYSFTCRLRSAYCYGKGCKFTVGIKTNCIKEFCGNLIIYAYRLFIGVILDSSECERLPICRKCNIAVGHSSCVIFLTVKIPTVKGVSVTNGYILRNIKAFAKCKSYRIYFTSSACYKGYGVDRSFPNGIKNSILILIPSFDAVSVLVGIHYTVFVGIAEEFISVTSLGEWESKLCSVGYYGLTCGYSISTVKHCRITRNAYRCSTRSGRAECSCTYVICFTCGYVIYYVEVLSVRATVIVVNECGHWRIIKSSKGIVIARRGNSYVTRNERHEHEHLLGLTVKSYICITVNSNGWRILYLYPLCVKRYILCYKCGKVVGGAITVGFCIPTAKDISASLGSCGVFKRCGGSYSLSCNATICTV